MIQSRMSESTQVFVCQEKVEQATEVHGLEDLNMAQIKEEIQKYDDYKMMIESVKKGDNSKTLYDQHIAKKWASCWDTISLVGNERSLIMDRSKVILKGMQTSLVEDLHGNTHGSFQRIKEMIQESMVWLRWKETTQAVVNACEPCKIFAPSKPEGPHTFITFL